MKNLPFTQDQVNTWVKDIPTPFYVYDEQGIMDTVKDLLLRGIRDSGNTLQ